MKTNHILQNALLLSGVALAGCHKAAEQAGAETGNPKIEAGRIVFPTDSKQLGMLLVEPAKQCENCLTHLSGKLTWDENVTVRVFTPFAGRVTGVEVEAGSSVEKGSILATIASGDFGQAQSDGHKAQADLALGEKNLARVRELAAHGSAPAKDVAGAEADWARASAEQARTAARLAMYGSSGDSIDNNYALKSPIGGVVVEKNVSAGQEVRPDQMLAGVERLAAPLLVVTDPSRLWLQMDATEADLVHLRSGQTITVHAGSLPGQNFTAKIDRISDGLDPVTRTSRVRASVGNTDRLLKAEMLVSVDAASPANSTAVDVPAKAVFFRNDRHFVFTEPSHGTFIRREVQVGSGHEGRVEILSGIQPGDSVVVDGVMLLQQIIDGDSAGEIASAPDPRSQSAKATL